MSRRQFTKEELERLAEEKFKYLTFSEYVALVEAGLGTKEDEEYVDYLLRGRERMPFPDYLNDDMPPF